MTTNPKHVPERTCVACRKKGPQAGFVRLTRTEGGWSIQAGRHRSGRGVYLCAAPECQQEKRLRRTFRADAEKVAELLAAHLRQQHGIYHPEPSNTPDQPMPT